MHPSVPQCPPPTPPSLLRFRDRDCRHGYIGTVAGPPLALSLGAKYRKPKPNRRKPTTKPNKTDTEYFGSCSVLGSWEPNLPSTFGKFPRFTVGTEGNRTKSLPAISTSANIEEAQRPAQEENPRFPASLCPSVPDPSQPLPRIDPAPAPHSQAHTAHRESARRPPRHTQLLRPPRCPPLRRVSALCAASRGRGATSWRRETETPARPRGESATGFFPSPATRPQPAPRLLHLVCCQGLFIPTFFRSSFKDLFIPSIWNMNIS
jgi:hypothetical protein